MRKAMFEGPTRRTIEDHVRAIDLCLRSGLTTPALTLVYVGMDVFGALGRPIGKKRRVREDFVTWADRYMIKPKQLPVTALELYGARCGVLHTLGPESDLSIAGTVRPIIYAWGNRETDSANAVIEKTTKSESASWVMMKIEDIAHAFLDGVASFEEDVDAAAQEFQDEVAARARKMFGQFSQFPGTYTPRRGLLRACVEAVHLPTPHQT